ncbi:MAG TPA: hypothetical protein VI818_05555 [Candidatus Thermoplasmatota archaeon]|nr:hypothetical protein [Candidatus Thermoplasmatota archaeon]
MQTRTANKVTGSLYGIAILVLLFSGYIALVYHGDIDAGASWVSDLEFGIWIAGFSVAMAVLFLVVLILFLAPPSQTVAAPPASAPSGVTEMRITCPSCQKDYIIDDTGERPLLHTCPHCGTTHTLEAGQEWAQAPAEAPSPAAAPAAPAKPQPPVVERMEGGIAKKYMVMRCGDCKTQFEIPFTTARPVVTTCANCGRRGILR